jgi:hypothetical protein
MSSDTVTAIKSLATSNNISEYIKESVTDQGAHIIYLELPSGIHLLEKHLQKQAVQYHRDKWIDCLQELVDLLKA